MWTEFNNRQWVEIIQNVLKERDAITMFYREGEKQVNRRETKIVFKLLKL